MFHFIEFGDLSYVHVLIHHTVGASSELQGASALSSERDNSGDCTLIKDDGFLFKDFLFILCE